MVVFLLFIHLLYIYSIVIKFSRLFLIFVHNCAVSKEVLNGVNHLEVEEKEEEEEEDQHLKAVC